MQFDDKQRALIIQADEVNERSTEVFMKIADLPARDYAAKLPLLEDFHILNLMEIDLLRQAGDPAADRKLADWIDRYAAWKQEYLDKMNETWVEKPGSEFDRCRREFLRSMKG